MTKHSPKDTRPSFDGLIKEAYFLIDEFAKHDPKPWPATAKALDLMAHGGQTAALILEAEGYKEKISPSTALPGELATLFFIILDIAKEYQIDLSDALRVFLSETKQQLNKKG